MSQYLEFLRYTIPGISDGVVGRVSKMLKFYDIFDGQGGVRQAVEYADRLSSKQKYGKLTLNYPISPSYLEH